MDNNEIKTGGIGFSGALQIAFIVLKLCNVIDWSWWWVLFPTLLGIGLFVVFLLLVLITFIVEWVKDGSESK